MSNKRTCSNVNRCTASGGGGIRQGAAGRTRSPFTDEPVPAIAVASSPKPIEAWRPTSFPKNTDHFTPGWVPFCADYQRLRWTTSSSSRNRRCWFGNPPQRRRQYRRRHTHQPANAGRSPRQPKTGADWASRVAPIYRQYRCSPHFRSTFSPPIFDEIYIGPAVGQCAVDKRIFACNTRIPVGGDRAGRPGAWAASFWSRGAIRFLPPR